MENFNISCKRGRDEFSSQQQLRNKPRNNDKKRLQKRQGGNEGVLSDIAKGEETPPHVPPIDTTRFFANVNNPEDVIAVIDKKKKNKNEYGGRGVFDSFEEACDYEKICPKSTKQTDENSNGVNVWSRESDKFQWACIFCSDVLFYAYQEACKHEATCKYNPKSNSNHPPKNDSVASSSICTSNNNISSTELAQINQMSSLPLSSIENNVPKDIVLGKETLQWTCVHCEKAEYPTYQELCEHENKCPDNPANYS